MASVYDTRGGVMASPAILVVFVVMLIVAMTTVVVMSRSWYCPWQSDDDCDEFCKIIFWLVIAIE